MFSLLRGTRFDLPAWTGQPGGRTPAQIIASPTLASALPWAGAVFLSA